MILSRHYRRLATKALKYHGKGIPMKDAFDTDYEKEDTIVACMRVAIAVTKEAA